MISLPIHIKGKVSIQSAPESNITIDNLKNYLADSLQQEEANSVDIEENQIRFDVGWFRPFWNWKILLPISTGFISLKTEDETIHVSYKLSFEKVVIVATIIMLMAFIFLNLNNFEMKDNIIIILMLWFWLVGNSIFITAIRFPRFIKRCAVELEKCVYYWDKK